MVSTFPARRRAISAAVLASLLLPVLMGGTADAATVRWAGLGTSGLWSDPLNWSPAAVPAEGDDLLFEAAPPNASSTLDMSRSFAAIGFANNAAAFFLHVSGEGDRELSLSGAGLRNLTSGTGPIRQALFADAGSSGGSLRFSGNAGINVGLSESARPVDLTARGGTSTGMRGGHIVFEDKASLGTDTFDALRVEGAAAAGAAGADATFRGSAVSDRWSAVVVNGGSSLQAAGGLASFAELARAAGNVTVLAGQGGGLGGRLAFAGQSTLAATGNLIQAGSQSPTAGAEAATSLRDDAKMLGSAQNGAGTAAGANGARLEFFDRASHDTRGLAPELGTQIILNSGSSQPGALGAALVFHDDSAVSGTRLVVTNATGESAGAGTAGGRTVFMDRARAGGATYDNAGTAAAGAIGGSTSFLNQANAENATLVARGGSADSALGGSVLFSGEASAASAQLRNEGGSATGARGGSTRFEGAANAGQATIINAAGAVGGGAGGTTTFADSAGAGNAYISNETSLGTGGSRGSTLFTGSASAQNATIDNQGGTSTVNAFTVFSQSASAGHAAIFNFGGRAAGVVGGFTQFTEGASAGSATLVMAGGAVTGARGGTAEFFTGTSAGNATLDLRGAMVAGAFGGTLTFGQGSSAGNAKVTVQGSPLSNPGGPEDAVLTFVGNVSGAAPAASASSATFTIGGNAFAFGSAGRVLFTGGATAADASFTTLAGFDAGGKLSFEGSVLHPSSAENARITNGSRAVASGSNGDFGGATSFLANSSAGRAAILNEAGLTAFGAQTVFRANGTAADATIVNAGGSAGATGGISYFQDTSSAGRALITNQAGAAGAAGGTYFSNSATAGQSMITAAGASVAGGSGGRVAFRDQSTAALATLVAEGGSNGGAGGRIEFRQQATGGQARVQLNAGSAANAGGVLDISGVDVWLPIGSIEGGGQVELGAKSLIVGGNGRATTFSGLIRGDAPAVFPSLTVFGTLTLTGANLYAGRTTIGDGLNANSGKLIAANTSGSATGSGDVLIQRGGTLAGSGFIAGPVTLQDGGTIAPGDPVTLTLRDSLVWDGGGVIRLVLGADSASSDHLAVHRLVRGSPGRFTVEFVNAGITAGSSYDLLSFDELDGFAASDFTFDGAAGSFSLVNGSLGFTVAVPEPAAALLMLMGCLTLVITMRGRGASGLR